LTSDPRGSGIIWLRKRKGLIREKELRAGDEAIYKACLQSVYHTHPRTTFEERGEPASHVREGQQKERGDAKERNVEGMRREGTKLYLSDR